MRMHNRTVAWGLFVFVWLLFGVEVSVAGAAALQPSSELEFTPIAPCRAFAANVSTNHVRDFQITGSSGFPAQGGPDLGCGVPVSATAVAISLTAQDATGTGSLTAYATGSPRPGVTALSYRTNIQATAGAIVGLGLGKLTIYPRQAAKVLGDVTGYYAPPIAGELITAYANNGPTLINATSRVTKIEGSSNGPAIVYFDRDVSYCSASLTAAASTADKFVAYVGKDFIYVYVYTRSSNGSLFFAEGEPVFFSLHC